MHEVYYKEVLGSILTLNYSGKRYNIDWIKSYIIDKTFCSSTFLHANPINGKEMLYGLISN